MQYVIGYVLSDISEESKNAESNSSESNNSESSQNSVENQILNDRVVDKLEQELQKIQPLSEVQTVA